MNTLTRLKAASSMADVAAILGYSKSGLAYILYKGPPTGRYTAYDIPKRAGGMRQIHAPDTRLKALQKSLVSVLAECNSEIANIRGFRSKFSHGFEKDRSIITNAWQHKNRRFVLNLDLVDFFTSINFGRVRGFFIKNRDFSLHPAVATVVAQIGCFQNSLPQGAPSSPILSNMVTHILDIRLGKLAAVSKTTYTRYADDVTFSTNEKNFPLALAQESLLTAGQWVLSGALLAR